MPSAISREQLDAHALEREEGETSSLTGVRMRLVNSWPDIGTMLKVGLSAARCCRLSVRLSGALPSKPEPPTPPPVSKLNVAAMLDVTVKCGGRSVLSRATFSSRISCSSAAHRLVVAEHRIVQGRRPDASGEAEGRRDERPPSAGRMSTLPCWVLIVGRQP